MKYIVIPLTFVPLATRPASFCAAARGFPDPARATTEFESIAAVMRSATSCPWVKNGLRQKVRKRIGTPRMSIGIGFLLSQTNREGTL
jgi:hypothetical protein